MSTTSLSRLLVPLLALPSFTTIQGRGWACLRRGVTRSLSSTALRAREKRTLETTGKAAGYKCPFCKVIFFFCVCGLTYRCQHSTALAVRLTEQQTHVDVRGNRTRF